MAGGGFAVPSSKPQFNVRLDPVAAALAAELPAVVEAKVGVVVTQADLIRMALIALAEKYARPVPRSPPPVTKPKTKPRKR